MVEVNTLMNGVSQINQDEKFGVIADGDIERSLERICGSNLDKIDLLLVIGSSYMMGDVRKFFKFPDEFDEICLQGTYDFSKQNSK